MSDIKNAKRVIEAELKLLRINLVYVVILTCGGIIPILAFRPSVSTCYYITFFPWIISGFLLFSVTHIIRMHIAGEGYEWAEALFKVFSRKTQEPQPASSKSENEGSTGLFDNPFIRFYLSLIAGIFFVQTSLFILLPLYVNYSVGGATTAIMITMLSVIVLIGSMTFFARLFKSVVIIAVVLYICGLTVHLFPQIGFYTKLDKVVRLVPLSTAQKAREIDELRNKQREQINNTLLEEAKRWQQQNPARELPSEYQEVIEAAGQNLTVEEYRAKKAGKNSTAASVATSSPVRKAENKTAKEILSGKVTYNHWDPQNLGVVRIAVLDPGEYIFTFDGGHMQWANGQYIPIPPEGLVGMKTASQQDLPVPSVSPGARIIKIDNGQWQAAGRQIKIRVTEKKSGIYASINARQNVSVNFVNNKGADNVSVKVI